MMTAEQEKTFAEVLDETLNAETLQVSQLFRFSDMAPHDFETFCERWAETPVERRRQVTRHLADFSEDNFAVEFAPVFEVCLKDSDAETKMAALDGLWDTTNVRVVSPIIDLMQADPTVEVRAAAASALAHFVLLGEWGQISSYVAERIVNALLEVYKNEESPLIVRRSAIEALGAASHEEVPHLIAEAYEDDDRQMQQSALFAMGNSADPRWLETLLAEMESPYYQLRAEAARAAGEIGSSQAISQLATLAFDEEADVQIAAIQSLGKIGGDAAERILKEFLDDHELAEIHEAVNATLEASNDLLGSLDFDLFDLDEDELDDDAFEDENISDEDYRYDY